MHFLWIVVELYGYHRYFVAWSYCWYIIHCVEKKVNHSCFCNNFGKYVAILIIHSFVVKFYTVSQKSISDIINCNLKND